MTKIQHEVLIKKVKQVAFKWFYSSILYKKCHCNSFVSYFKGRKVSKSKVSLLGQYPHERHERDNLATKAATFALAPLVLSTALAIATSFGP